MFGFLSKPVKIAEKMKELSIDGANQFLNYIKEDTNIYSNCINDNPIKNTASLFLISIYDDMLRTKYNPKQCFTMVYTAISSMFDNSAKDMMLNAYFQNQKQVNTVIDYYKKMPDFEVSDVLTKAFFGLIIDNKEYLMAELDNEIVNSNSYRKIKDYINGIAKTKTLLNI